MDLNSLVKFIVLGLVCSQVSCSNYNGSPECDNAIALTGVKDSLYREIGQGGDQYRFKNSLDFKNIETVKVTEEGRECTANLKIMRKYYLPINYEIAVDNEEYYVTFSGMTEGSKENVYRIINNMQPNLVNE